MKNISSNRYIHILLVLVVYLFCPNVVLANKASTVDVLFLYAPDALSQYAGKSDALDKRIALLVSTANDIYQKSGVQLRLKDAAHYPVDYDSDDTLQRGLELLSTKAHPAFKDVNRWRMKHKADVVVLLRTRKRDGCGKAWNVGDIANPEQDFWKLGGYAYADVAINCPNHTLVHEIAHLMGVVHSMREEPARGSAYDYGRGYGVPGDFVDVMATAEVYSLRVTDVLPLFSSPLLTCTGKSKTPYPCGIVEGRQDAADAVKAMNNVREQVARWSDDSDRDGMPDWFEAYWGLDPRSRADAAADADHDGLSNLNEFYAESYTNTACIQYAPRTARCLQWLRKTTDSDEDGIVDGEDDNPAVPLNAGMQPGATNK